MIIKVQKPKTFWQWITRQPEFYEVVYIDVAAKIRTLVEAAELSDDLEVTEAINAEILKLLKNEITLN